MENIYNRQQALNFKVPQSATVVGCGGTGTWTALFLAMMGTKNLRLVDGDLISLHNLNRLPFSTKAVNRFKVNVLKEMIEQLRPSCKVSTQSIKIQTSRQLVSNLGGMVFDCTDDGKLQEQIYETTKRKHLKYRRVGCDGYHFTVLSDRNKIFGAPSNTNGYRIVPSCVLTPVLAASLAVMSTQTENVKIMGDLKEMLK